MWWSPNIWYRDYAAGWVTEESVLHSQESKKISLVSSAQISSGIITDSYSVQCLPGIIPRGKSTSSLCLVVKARGTMHAGIWRRLKLSIYPTLKFCEPKLLVKKKELYHKLILQ
jgi:hypothetical protein